MTKSETNVFRLRHGVNYDICKEVKAEKIHLYIYPSMQHVISF